MMNDAYLYKNGKLEKTFETVKEAKKYIEDYYKEDKNANNAKV